MLSNFKNKKLCQKKHRGIDTQTHITINTIHVSVVTKKIGGQESQQEKHEHRNMKNPHFWLIFMQKD